MSEREAEALQLLEEHVDEDTGFLWTGGTEAQVISHMLLDRLEMDVPHLTVDTGNQFESIYDFRERYHSEKLFEWKTRQNRVLLKAIQDEDDPRDYHGQWNEEASKDAPVDRDEWTVSESCGKLKTQPMHEFIVEDDYTTLVTGVKRDDPLAGDDFESVVERDSPAEHTRINPLHDWDEEHVWAYIKFWFVDYPDIYDEGYRHTDAKCCTGDDAISEHGGEGFDDAVDEAQDRLRDMGYV